MKGIMILLLVVHSLLSTSVVFSQQIKFNKVLDGKKNSFGSIFSIVQDQKGFIWFASAQKGLQRYDGKRITTFNHNNDNPNSLSSNLAAGVTVDSSGHIWVGTMGSGLDRFDPETKKFTHFRHDANDPTSLGNDTIFSMITDRSGNIWIGTTRTLDKLNPATGKFTHYIIDELTNYVNTSSEFTSINAILEDRKGDIWIGWGDPFTGKKDGIGGLARLDKATGNFTKYKHDPDNPNSLSDNNVFNIYEDSKNNLWVCTKGNGLQTLDRTTGNFTQYDYFDPAHPEKISRPPIGGSELNVVTFVSEDIKGRLWIGSANGGMNMYDPLLKKTTHFGSVSNDKSNLFSKDTLSGYTDSSAIKAFTSKDGLLWITSLEGSIYNINFSNTTISFVSLDASAGSFYYEEGKNILWILSDIGIIRKNLLNNQQKVFKHDPQNANSPASNSVFSIAGDGEGNIWLANHFNGLDKFNIKTEQFTHIHHDATNPASLVNDSTHILFVDRQHYLWIGTHNGLSRMDTKTGICTNYINDPNDSLSIYKGHINSIAQDKDDMIWIGTDVDVYSLDVKSGKFQRYRVGEQLTNLCVDETGQIWAASLGGLYHLNKQRNGFKKYTTQAFPDGIDNVWGMVEDNNGNLWISTSENIIKINKERDGVRIFNEAHGVRSFTGIWLRNIRTKDGRLFLGGLKGFYSFKPEELIDDKTESIFNFTHFKIGREEIVAGEGSVLAKPIWNTNSIELNYSQSTISFEFEAIDYKSRGDIKYLYKLENYDDEWRDIGTEHKATFFDLPHGKYKLNIKAVSSDGSVTEKSMDITITPPWWQTWWAYCLFAIFVIVAGYLIYRYQKYYIVTRERERTQQKELAQAREIEKAYTELKATQTQLVHSEKMASLGELTAGIAHEIQNPLNFVNNFSEVNAELIDELNQEINKGNYEEAALIAKDIKDNEAKIKHHGKRADAIVKGMLQHSRTSSGVKEPTDINVLADEYLRLAYHGLRAKDKTFNAKMETDFDESIGKINVVSQDIGRVILNLITNAFYAVDEKKKLQPNGYEPTVKVSTKRIGDNVEIKISDNGNGIPERVLDKIFQPFFTTKPTGQGTGLGLSLSYDIVKTHGGNLKVETKEGEGSEFKINLNIK
jgi:signal transduction histidine kinase/ligand-binding sensor domain-containing protein